MTLAQKLKRCARTRRYYLKHIDRIRAQKRGYMAERKHRIALEKAIVAARIILNYQPRSEA